jgi:GT2 family glycosyltransferase
MQHAPHTYFRINRNQAVTMTLLFLKEMILRNPENVHLWETLFARNHNYIDEKYCYLEGAIEYIVEQAEKLEYQKIQILWQDILNSDYFPAELKMLIKAIAVCSTNGAVAGVKNEIDELLESSNQSGKSRNYINILQSFRIEEVSRHIGTYGYSPSTATRKYIRSTILPLFIRGGTLSVSREEIQQKILAYNSRIIEDDGRKSLRFAGQDSEGLAEIKQQILLCFENDKTAHFLAAYILEYAINELQAEQPGEINVDTPLATVIIPVYNKIRMTVACITSLIKQRQGINYEIIIADDCSSGDSYSNLNSLTWLNVVRTNTNLGFIGNCNNAAKYAKGRYIVFINNDTLVNEYCIRNLVATFENFKNVGIVGGKILNIDNSVQECGGIVWPHGEIWNFGRDYSHDYEFQTSYVREVDYVSGCLLCIDSQLWTKLNGFDEHYWPAYCEDTDICIRARQEGKRILMNPEASIFHLEGMSNTKDLSTGLKQYQRTNIQKLYSKWKKEILLSSATADESKSFLASRSSIKGAKTVVFVDHFVPTIDRDAGSKSAYSIIIALKRLGYEIIFIPENFAKIEPYTSLLESQGICVFYGDYAALNYEEILTQQLSRLDLIFLSRPHISMKFINFFKGNFPDTPIIYYMHDLHGLREFLEENTTASPIDYVNDVNRLCTHEEKYLIGKANVALTPSAKEVALLAPFFSNVSSIPLLSFDILPYQKITLSNLAVHKKRKGSIRAYFVGGFRHGPNVASLHWFLDEVIHRLDTNMIIDIIGSECPPDLIRKIDGFGNIVYRGSLSDEDLSSSIIHSHICLAPILYGAGVKGKTLEALYHGNIVVGTDYAFEGIEDLPIDCIRRCNTPSDFVLALNRLSQSSDDDILDACIKAHLFAKDSFSSSRLTFALHSMLSTFPDVLPMTQFLNRSKIAFETNLELSDLSFGFEPDRWLLCKNCLSFKPTNHPFSLDINLYLPQAVDGYELLGEHSIKVILFNSSQTTIEMIHNVTEGLNSIKIPFEVSSQLPAVTTDETFFLIFEPSYTLSLPVADSRSIFAIMTHLIYNDQIH